MPSEDIAFAQEDFLRKGGLFVEAIKAKRKAAEDRRRAGLDEDTFQEYPKSVRVNPREEEFERSTEDLRGKTITWKEKKTVWDEYIVWSAEEEDRVLSGGKTSDAIEDERQTLMRRCRAAGIRVDQGWSVVRLRKELGEHMDEPEPPNKMEALEAELAQLKRMAEMQDEIDRLKAQLTPASGEVEGLRTELAALGVVADKRWGVARLRDELERATAPATA